jgi:hypothetical protein
MTIGVPAVTLIRLKIPLCVSRTWARVLTVPGREARTAPRVTQAFSRSRLVAAPWATAVRSAAVTFACSIQSQAIFESSNG